MVNPDVFLSDTIRNIDNNCGVSTHVLMESAALALYNRISYENKLHGNICIVCGKGNNGGDGYALGILLKNKGFSVSVVSVEEPITALAIHYKNEYIRIGGGIDDNIQDAIINADVIVDCIFGFSFHGTVNSKIGDVIRCVNNSKGFVISADIPSGISADSHLLPTVYVQADVTCTFTVRKLALVAFPARLACGKIYVEDIGVPKNALDATTLHITIADKRLISNLPKRPINGHKGTFGTLTALCGSADMCGAAYLACLSALRSGIGLVKLFTDEICGNIIKSKLAEPIIKNTVSAESIISNTKNALLIGCGCGRNYDGIIKDLLLKAKTPIILDADGINFLANNIELISHISSPLVLTPHPAEMGRLMGLTTEEINANRIDIAQSFAKEHNAVLVLKGAGTVIAAPDGRLCISNCANTGLAKGGSGDVLAGLIASLIAQGMDCYSAACLGVYLHCEAAERLADKIGVYAMLPSDLPEEIGRIMHFG